MFSKRIIELGEPLWQIQKDALTNLPWIKPWRKNEKKKEPGSGKIPTVEASTTATDNDAAVAAVRDPGEDEGETADEDGDDDDDVGGDPLQGEGDDDGDDDDDVGGVSLLEYELEAAAYDDYVDTASFLESDSESAASDDYVDAPSFPEVDSEPSASDPEGLGGVSVAVGRMGVDD